MLISSLYKGVKNGSAKERKRGWVLFFFFLLQTKVELVLLMNPSVETPTPPHPIPKIIISIMATFSLLMLLLFACLCCQQQWWIKKKTKCWGDVIIFFHLSMFHNFPFVCGTVYINLRQTKFLQSFCLRFWMIYWNCFFFVFFWVIVGGDFTRKTNIKSTLWDSVSVFIHFVFC